jgi:hypothetical protein
MIKYLCLALVLLCLGSCNTPHRIAKKLNKFDLVHPEVVAKFTRDKYPCIDKPIDTITKIDTAYIDVEVECPPQDTFVIEKNDTIIVKGKPTIIKKKVSLPQHTITITKLVKDSAEIKVLAVENKNCIDEVKRKWLWIQWLFVLLVCSLILNAILLSRK